MLFTSLFTYYLHTIYTLFTYYLHSEDSECIKNRRGARAPEMPVKASSKMKP